jgi:hypothetical protein
MLRPPSPPYSVENAEFAFPALAALMGRLPLGAGREAMLAALLAARLAAGAIPGNLPVAARRQRAASAAHWLRAMCPDAKVRVACTALADATGGDAPESVAKALQTVIDVTAGQLDTAARSELAGLAATLRRAAPGAL